MTRCRLQRTGLLYTPPVRFQLEYHQQFSCPEVGLSCDNWSQAAAFLTPWCCVLAFRHVVASLETAAEQVSSLEHASYTHCCPSCTWTMS